MVTIYRKPKNKFVQVKLDRALRRLRKAGKLEFTPDDVPELKGLVWDDCEQKGPECAKQTGDRCERDNKWICRPCQPAHDEEHKENDR